jgi:hypothetical protein
LSQEVAQHKRRAVGRSNRATILRRNRAGGRPAFVAGRQSKTRETEVETRLWRRRISERKVFGLTGNPGGLAARNLEDITRLAWKKSRRKNRTSRGSLPASRLPCCAARLAMSATSPSTSLTLTMRAAAHERDGVHAIVETRGVEIRVGKLLRHIDDNIGVERLAEAARAAPAVGTGRLGFDILVCGIPLRDPRPRVPC